MLLVHTAMLEQGRIDSHLNDIACDGGYVAINPDQTRSGSGRLDQTRSDSGRLGQTRADSGRLDQRGTVSRLTTVVSQHEMLENGRSHLVSLSTMGKNRRITMRCTRSRSRRAFGFEHSIEWNIFDRLKIYLSNSHL